MHKRARLITRPQTPTSPMAKGLTLTRGRRKPLAAFLVCASSWDLVVSMRFVLLLSFRVMSVRADWTSRAIRA